MNTQEIIAQVSKAAGLSKPVREEDLRYHSSIAETVDRVEKTLDAYERMSGRRQLSRQVIASIYVTVESENRA